MYEATAYVSPPPTAPLQYERSAIDNPPPSDTQIPAYTRARAVSMFDRNPAAILKTFAPADLRPLRVPQREKKMKGRVTVKNPSWNWGGDSETHPYLLAAASSSAVGVDGHELSSSYPREPQSAIESRMRYREQQEELSGRPQRRPSVEPVAPRPAQYPDERIFYSDDIPSPVDDVPLVPPPKSQFSTHKRTRSKTFTSSYLPSFPSVSDPKSRSETTLGKHKSKLTLNQFQLLVSSSVHVEQYYGDVQDREDDYRPRTRRGPGPVPYHLPMGQGSARRLEDTTGAHLAASLIIPPPPSIAAPQPPSPASFYSASSSPHSDPGYDSDTTSTAEATENDAKGRSRRAAPEPEADADADAEDLDPGAEDDNRDAGFDSDAALSLPSFYRNPRAVHSDETLGTMGSIGSIGTIGTVGTMGTMDTMGAALRSLGPTHRPTIRGIRSRVASVGKDGGVIMKEREKTPVTKTKGEGEKAGRLNPKATAYEAKTHAEPKPAPKESAEAREKENVFKSKGVLKPKDRRSLETPSSLALSTNLLGLPTPRDSTLITHPTTRPHSSALAAHKAMMSGNTDNNVQGTVPPQKVASQAAPPPRPPRRVHRVPPPLVLQPSTVVQSRSDANLNSNANPKALDNNKLAVTPRSATSFRFQFQPPPTPLSPALSFMSTMSTLSTVSTIAAVMMNRPKTKQSRISEKELRRRRFLKLTKTLGDDVPPELVSVKAAPKRSRTISFGSRRKEEKGSGGGKRDTMVENGKSGTKMKKTRKDSVDGRRKAGKRHSIAVSPLLETSFPSIPERDDPYNDDPISPLSPNVLRKYPSLRRRSTSNPNGRPVSETFSRTSVNPTPVLSPEPEDPEPSLVAPYFEDHPFRLVVEESSPTPGNTVPRFVTSDAKVVAPQSRKMTGTGPRVPSQPTSQPPSKPNTDTNDGRSSAYSMNNPWMRTSLALPLSYDTPFIEYALPCGVNRKVAEGKLGVGHHRRMSSLDAISPRRISTLDTPSDDTRIRDGLNRDRMSEFSGVTDGRFSAIGGLTRSGSRVYLDVPQEVGGDDEGEWENLENGVYRKERREGWSGEWNQPHIQTVIEKLRQL